MWSRGMRSDLRGVEIFMFCKALLCLESKFLKALNNDSSLCLQTCGSQEQSKLPHKGISLFLF